VLRGGSAQRRRPPATARAARVCSPNFADWLRGRTYWERCFPGLHGYFRVGAESWAGERSKLHPCSCASVPPSVSGRAVWLRREAPGKAAAQPLTPVLAKARAAAGLAGLINVQPRSSRLRAPLSLGRSRADPPEAALGGVSVFSNRDTAAQIGRESASPARRGARPSGPPGAPARPT
jgi:hypothetical protein